MSADPVLAFEKRFASKIGADYAIAVNSGTSALHAALEACDVRRGEVIVPALAPAMVAFAVIHAGAWPIFADVDPDTGLVTHETIARVIGKNTKAVIAVALHGLPVDVDPIRALCRDKGIKVIEDCAQCLIGRYKDVYAGTKADVGCFSCERKKHLTTGSEGGMIVTQDSTLATRARKFAGLGYLHMGPDGGATRVPEIHPGYKRFDTIGVNYRMSYAQAEIGLDKLKTIQDAVWTRQEIGYLWQNACRCSFQPHTYDADNTFYSAAYVLPLLHESEYFPVWKSLHQRFCLAGGDSFYAQPQVPYNEPALSEYKGLEANYVALDLQQRLVLLKTHYSLEEGKRQADILAGVLHDKTIERVS